jgi:hypothetical protein
MQFGNFKKSVIAIAALAATMTLSEKASAGWSAIAVDTQGYWGYAFNYGNLIIAERDAMNGCGRNRPGSRCSITHYTQSPCIAFSASWQGGFWYGQASGRDRSRVTSTALFGCRQGAGFTCNLLLDRCS